MKEKKGENVDEKAFSKYRHEKSPRVKKGEAR